MFAINYDGSGQMKKMLICLQVVAFAYKKEIKIMYYNFPSYEGVCYDETRIEKYYKEIIRKFAVFLKKLVSNHEKTYKYKESRTDNDENEKGVL